MRVGKLRIKTNGVAQVGLGSRELPLTVGRYPVLKLLRCLKLLPGCGIWNLSETRRGEKRSGENSG